MCIVLYVMNIMYVMYALYVMDVMYVMYVVRGGRNYFYVFLGGGLLITGGRIKRGSLGKQNSD